MIVEPAKESMIKGSIWHKTNEWINKHEKYIVENINTKNYSEIADIYRKEFAKALRNSIIHYKRELKEFNIKLLDLFNEYWPSMDQESKLRAYNVSLFATQNNLIGKELWEKLTPKIISEQYFKSEKLGLSGVIDVIEVHDNKIYVPVELKTGSVPAGSNAMWPGHKIQLATYMLLLEDAGKTVSEGIIRYKDSDEKRILVLNTFLKDEVLELTSKVNEMLSTFNLPDRIDNKKKCDKCSFKDICYDDSEITRLVKEAVEKQEK